MWLEGDQRGLSARLARPAHGTTDDVEMSEVNAVKAADRQGHGPDRFRGQPKMDLQLSTFSGTNVLRNGSVWPSATSVPSRS